MKKFFYLFLLSFCFSIAAKANPGDTTWVQANNRYIERFPGDTNPYGNRDTIVVFPHTGTTYRRIYMFFTLGKHQCPGYTYSTGSVPWCADWDYTVQNYLMTPGGDTLELGRLITPYANANNSLSNIPYTWTKNYIYDVTDYAALMHDTAAMRVFFSGYSGGFTIDVRFAFIEGTPDRNVTGITRLWNGSFNYGNSADPISNHFPVINDTAPPSTQSAILKFTITGHGSDNNGCCEFMSHNYQVLENSSQIAQYTIWRPTCGSNELYPQSGTWLYERGNWCPGAIVYSNFHQLQNITAGTHFSTDITFDSYTSPGGTLGEYTTEAQLIYYAGFNKNLDASLDEVLSPNYDNDYFRENPSAGIPTIHIKNTGATTINSIQLQYGIQGNSLSTYTWSGTLASEQDTIISLPVNYDIANLAGTTDTSTFIAQIIQVNGQTDDDATNNTLTSRFAPCPQWPVSFAVLMKTNNEGINGLNSGVCETSWQILDVNGAVVASRTNASLNTQYTDTVTLGPGAYSLVVTDLGCDGLDWWAFPSGTTAGSITVRRVQSPTTNLTLHGNNVSSYPNDFGCGFTQNFTTAWPAGVNNVTASDMNIEAYPNPAQNYVTVNITGITNVSGTIELIDALGRVVMHTACNNSTQTLNTSGFANGVYTIVYLDDKTDGNKLQTRLVIAK